MTTRNLLTQSSPVRIDEFLLKSADIPSADKARLKGILARRKDVMFDLTFRKTVRAGKPVALAYLAGSTIHS